MSGSSSESESAEPLLVAAPLLWRDVCFSLPAVRALATAGNSISILCPDSQKAFWKAAGFDSLITHPAGASARVIASLIKDVRRALLWEPGPAADAAAKAGVNERVGLPVTKLTKRLTRVLERKVRPGPTEHQVARFLDVAKLLGAEPMKTEHFAPIECVREDSSLLVVPESDYASNHEWFVDRWAELITRLKEDGSNPTIGLIRKGSLAQEIVNRTDCGAVGLDPADPGSYRGYSGLLGADGSIPHLAAAFGTTCAVLFGPGDPDLTRPLGRRHLIIRKKVECSPCFLDKCPIDLRCQDDLDLERVIERLKAFSPA